MSSFTQLLMQKGLDENKPAAPAGLPHRSRASAAAPAIGGLPKEEVPRLQELLAELDNQETSGSASASAQHQRAAVEGSSHGATPASSSSSAPARESRADQAPGFRWKGSGGYPEGAARKPVFQADFGLQEATQLSPDTPNWSTSFLAGSEVEAAVGDMRERCGEAFSSAVNSALRQKPQPQPREKPRPKEPQAPAARKPRREHWNFSFTVDREVVGAEKLQADEDGQPLPPSKDPRAALARARGGTGKKTEALPGMRGLRQAGSGPREEAGLARPRPIPSNQDNEWIQGLKAMQQSRHPELVQRIGKAPAEEFLERGSPLERRPLRCIRSAEPVYCSVNAIVDDWKRPG